MGKYKKSSVQIFEGKPKLQIYCWYANFGNFPILIHFVGFQAMENTYICTTPNRTAFLYLKYRGRTLNKFGYKKYKVSLFGVTKKSRIQIYHEKLVFIHLMVP